MDYVKARRVTKNRMLLLFLALFGGPWGIMARGRGRRADVTGNKTHPADNGLM